MYNWSLDMPPFAEEVIADQVGTTRLERLLDLRVEHWSVALVAKLMNRLVGNDELELGHTVRPSTTGFRSKRATLASGNR